MCDPHSHRVVSPTMNLISGTMIHVRVELRIYLYGLLNNCIK
jgi:hypothetical protein